MRKYATPFVFLLGTYRRMTLWKRSVVLVIFIGCFAVAGAAWFAQRAIESNADGRVFNTVAACPKTPVALVLGVAKNNNYWPRLQAAAELFHGGKVDAILVSGDNSTPDYDEPTNMKNDLVQLGVPALYITCDFAGRRTLDSVIRAKEIFGQTRFIIVSQRYHCERALYLAQQFGCDAVAYSASDGEGYSCNRNRAREMFARVKAVLDPLFGVRPHFLGKQEVVALRDR